jgi:hypothetical protein
MHPKHVLLNTRRIGLFGESRRVPVLSELACCVCGPMLRQQLKFPDLKFAFFKKIENKLLR